VRFGASVTAQESTGETTIHRLVGVDETDLGRDWVSWQSPVARALLNRQLGQRVSFVFSAGQTELGTMKIEYM
jgi:transcription elongation factor GreB